MLAVVLVLVGQLVNRVEQQPMVEETAGHITQQLRVVMEPLTQVVAVAVAQKHLYQEQAALASSLSNTQ
jgi:Na+-transporting methylmalonyl-CoA/oxaloacetate decarboxylase gamma subunit